MTRLTVVGDALLDRDLDGRAERLAPDAPVPVVDAIEARRRAGGAGLAATLAARAGFDVTLVCALGSDGPGEELRTLLGEAGVTVIDLSLDGPTPEKVRVLAGGHPVVRLDHGAGTHGCGPLAADALDGADAVLVSDYGRGVAAEPTVRAALTRVRVPLVWDPHPRGPVPGSRGDAGHAQPRRGHRRGGLRGPRGRRTRAQARVAGGRRCASRAVRAARCSSPVTARRWCCRPRG